MTIEHTTPETLRAALEDCWVVIILDPDWEDWSPWSVVANDIGSAVEKAVQDWEAWLSDPADPNPDPLPKPHIIKVYRNTWITEIAWWERSSGGLGSYDMSKLANPR